MKKYRILITDWDEGYHRNRLEFFQKRYNNISPSKFEFIPFFYSDYFKKDFLRRKPQKLLNSVGLDSLYREERHPSYLKMLEDFKDLCQQADIVLFNIFCAIHPNFLYDECSNIVKILYAIDDPASSFKRTTPYVFAADVCAYVSLSYNATNSMEEQLLKWGAKKTYFAPLGVYHLNRKDDLHAIDSGNRTIPLIYVGGMYPSKIDRLTKLKNVFGSDLEIYGRWKPWGLKGLAYTLLHWRKHRIFPWVIKPLTPAQLPQYYQKTKIGFNMHWGENTETGNARLYQLPANGVMQICNRGANNKTGEIFTEDKEIVLYDDIEEAVDKIKFYLNNDTLREKIAWEGYKRVLRDYKQEHILENLFNWTIKEFNL